MENCSLFLLHIVKKTFIIDDITRTWGWTNLGVFDLNGDVTFGPFGKIESFESLYCPGGGPSLWKNKIINKEKHFEPLSSNTGSFFQKLLIKI